MWTADNAHARSPLVYDDEGGGGWWCTCAPDDDDVVGRRWRKIIDRSKAEGAREARARAWVWARRAVELRHRMMGRDVPVELLLVEL